MNRHLAGLTKHPLGAFLLCLNLVLLLLYGPLFTQTLFWRDLLHTYQPFHDFISGSLRAGDFPLWNPYLFSGTPQMAALEPPVLYPATWLFIWLDFSSAVGLTVWLHLNLAALGFYGLGREYGWHWGSSLAAALTFVLSGVMVSILNVYPLLWSSAWLPVLLWLLHRLCMHPGPRTGLLLAGAYALQILSGHLEIVYFTTLLLLGYAGYRRYQTRQPQTLRWLAVALLLGIGLAMAQLWPSFELLQHSVRQQGVQHDIALRWSTHPWRLLTFWLPDILGNPADRNALIPLLIPNEDDGRNFIFASSYFGILAGVLALGAVFSRSVGHARFWLAVLGITLWLSMGRYSNVFIWAYDHVPGLHFFRYPGKALILVGFALAMLAGSGLEALWQRQISHKRLGLALGIPALGLMGALLLFGFPTPILQWLLPLAQAWSDAPLAHIQRGLAAAIHQRALGLLWPTGTMAVLGLLLWGWQTQRLSRSYLLLLVNLLLVVDSGRAARGYVWLTSRSEIQRPSPVAQTLQQLPSLGGRMVKLNENQLPPQAYLKPYGDQWLLGNMHFLQENLQNNQSLKYRFYNAFGNWPARLQPIDTLQNLYQEALAAHQTKVVDTLETLLAIRYLHLHQPAPYADLFESAQYRKIQSWPHLQSVLLEKKSWLPRIHFKYQAIVMTEPEKILQAIGQSATNGFDAHQQLLVLKNPDYEQALKQVPPAAAAQKKWSEPQVSETNQALRITFNTNTSGYLVIADNWYPGWQAWDKGQSTPLLQVNYHQKALRVGPGEHVIELRYQPTSFYGGMALSCLSVLLWVGLWGYGRRRENYLAFRA